MNKFIIYTHGERYYPKVFTFPGGEINVSLPEIIPIDIAKYSINAKVHNSDDILTLLLLKNALDNHFKCNFSPIYKHLYLPYLPYSRQDRICNPKEAFSLKKSLLNATFAPYLALRLF